MNPDPAGRSFESGFRFALVITGGRPAASLSGLFDSGRRPLCPSALNGASVVLRGARYSDQIPYELAA